MVCPIFIWYNPYNHLQMAFKFILTTALTLLNSHQILLNFNQIAVFYINFNQINKITHNLLPTNTSVSLILLF